MAKRTTTKADQRKRSRLTAAEFQNAVERANGLHNEGQLTEAAELLEATLKAAPSSYTYVEKSAIWEQMGDMYTDLGTLTTAGKYYRRFLRYVKDAARSRGVTLKLVDVYWQRGKLGQIVNLLEGIV